MNCLTKTRATAPILEPVRASIRNDTRVRWIRVHDLPDFVDFNHGIQVKKVLTDAIPSSHRASAVGDDGNGGFTRLTIGGRSHTLPLHVAGEGEGERVRTSCLRDLQLLAATQV